MKPKTEAPGRIEQGVKLSGCRWCKRPLVKYHGALLCRQCDHPEAKK